MYHVLGFLVFFLILDFSDRFALYRLLDVVQRFEKTSKRRDVKSIFTGVDGKVKEAQARGWNGKVLSLVGSEEFCRHTP